MVAPGKVPLVLAVCTGVETAILGKSVFQNHYTLLRLAGKFSPVAQATGEKRLTQLPVHNLRVVRPGNSQHLQYVLAVAVKGTLDVLMVSHKSLVAVVLSHWVGDSEENTLSCFPVLRQVSNGLFSRYQVQLYCLVSNQGLYQITINNL